MAFSRGPGGFRELREAGRIHFHLSWYLSDYVVTSYDQKPGGGIFFTVHGIAGPQPAPHENKATIKVCIAPTVKGRLNREIIMPVNMI